MPGSDPVLRLRGRCSEREALSRLVASVRAGRSWGVWPLAAEAGTPRLAKLAAVAEPCRGFIARYGASRPRKREGVFRAETEPVHDWRRLLSWIPMFATACCPPAGRGKRANDLFQQATPGAKTRRSCRSLDGSTSGT